MGLKDRLEAATQPEQKPSIVDRWLTKLDAEDAAALRAALNDPSIPHRRIESVMNAEGHTLSDKAISRWRRLNGVEAAA